MPTGNAAERACSVCGRPVSGRLDRRYCSRRCQNAAFYARHAEARRAERRARYHQAHGTAPPAGGRAELRARIAAALVADPRRSDREHARRLGADAGTVARVRAELVEAGAIPAVWWVIGRDGRPHVTARAGPAPVGADRRYRAWTAEEDRYVREHWGEPTREVARALGRTQASVLHRRTAPRPSPGGG